MNYITLAWTANGERVTRTLEVGESTLEPGVFRIGRDPDQCDVVMPSATERDRTVSRCHVEIAFDADRFGFYLTNLKANNPPYIGGQPVTAPVKLTRGCTIELGEVELVVEDIAAVPETIIIQRPRPSAPQDQATILIDRSTPAASTPQGSLDVDATIPPEPSPQTPPVVISASEPIAQPPAQSPAPAAATPPPAPSIPLAADAAPPAPPAPQPSTNPPHNPASPPPGSVFDRVKDQLFSCPNGHKYTLAEAKELGWICKYDGYLITSTFVAK